VGSNRAVAPVWGPPNPGASGQGILRGPPGPGGAPGENRGVRAPKAGQDPAIRTPGVVGGKGAAAGHACGKGGCCRFHPVRPGAMGGELAGRGLVGATVVPVLEVALFAIDPNPGRGRFFPPRDFVTKGRSGGGQGPGEQ